jgi:cyanophycinase
VAQALIIGKHKGTNDHMHSLFLLGGGGRPDSLVDTYGRFLEAATTPEGCRIAMVIAEVGGSFDEDFQAYADLFLAAGAASTMLNGVRVSPTAPLRKEHLALLQPTGVFVCGGVTPTYRESLCVDRAWLIYLSERDIVFGGVSAGAAIASEQAIVGGWRAERDRQARQILFQGASEGRDLLDVRPGLGLVPFAVDVHASQWGTLTRLIHAVELGLVRQGLAIDEDTMLHVQTGQSTVYGNGHVYAVTAGADGNITVAIHTAGAEIRLHDSR